MVEGVIKLSSLGRLDNDNVDFRNGEAGTKIQIHLGEDNGLLQCSTNVRWEALIRDLEMWFTEMGLELCKGV